MSARSVVERMVHQSDIEAEILRLSGLLEEATGELATASENAAHGEADYRVAYARAYLTHRPKYDKLTDKIREAEATVECEKELTTYKVAAARQLALQEKCRQLRAQLDAVRTLSANVRGQT